MEVNEAKRIVEEANPNLKAAYAVPFKDMIVFKMVGKKNGQTVFNNLGYAVDVKTKKAITYGPFDIDFTGYEEALRNDAVYFSEQGMKMATMRTL